MKKTLLLISLGLFIISCSSDDNNNGSDNNTVTETTDFLPETTGNYWVYKTDTDGTAGRDSLYTDNDTVIGANTYRKYRTAQLPSGFYSNTMNNNGVRKENGKLLLTGGASIAISEALPFNLAVTDFVIFDQNALPEEIMGTLSGTIDQEIQGLQVKFVYTLSSKAKADMATYTVRGQPVYTNVKPVETTLNLSITVSGFPIMQPQNVLVSTQYYAEGIGVVFADTAINYQLIDLSFLGIELPIPTTGEQHQTEVLVDYQAE